MCAFAVESFGEALATHNLPIPAIQLPVDGMW
jgi:hypothetical protein